MSAKTAFIDAAAVCLRVGREAGDRMRQELLHGYYDVALKLQGEQSGAIACAEELIRLARRVAYEDFKTEEARKELKSKMIDDAVKSKSPESGACVFCGEPGNTEGMQDTDDKPTCLSCYIKRSDGQAMAEHVRLGK